MITAKDLAFDTLQMIGVHSEEHRASDESIDIVREELNEFMAELTDDDIELSFVPVEFADDFVSIPLSAETAIKTNLAISVAPYFDNGDIIVSPKLKQKAIETLERMKRNSQIVVIPNKQVSGTMPLGAGNKHGVDSRKFAGPEFTISDQTRNTDILSGGGD